MERKHNRPGLESPPGLAEEEEETMSRKDPSPKADRRRVLTGVVAARAASAQGSCKVGGKPLMTLCHGTVGLQHATMGIYNAWCDRVPVIVVGGNDMDAATRPPGVPTFHSAQDINALVRDFTKWDDTPVSLQHFSQSFVRAYKIAMTPPYGPVMISLDAGLQQEPMKEHGGEKPYIPRYVPTAPPQGDSC